MAGNHAAPESWEPESEAVDLEPTTDAEDAPDDELDDDQLEDDEAIDDEALEEDDVPPADGPPAISHVRLALIAGLVVVLALGGLTGWLGYRAKQSRDADLQRQTFLQVGRQGAINLTTLDYEHIDADVQRILDSATGTFYDDFQQRAPSFTEVVRQVKSKSVGTVTAAALESGDTATQAEVLVAVTVKSVIVGQPEQQPRAWRMRILVQRIQDDTKVSNVEFVA